MSVDKPPLGLWIQAASAALFGYNGVSLLLPQALAGVLAVELIYHLVRRHLAPTAGLVATLVLALQIAPTVWALIPVWYGGDVGLPLAKPDAIQESRRDELPYAQALVDFGDESAWRRVPGRHCQRTNSCAHHHSRGRARNGARRVHRQ